jgi:hypothetical protein
MWGQIVRIRNLWSHVDGDQHSDRLRVAVGRPSSQSVNSSSWSLGWIHCCARFEFAIGVCSLVLYLGSRATFNLPSLVLRHNDPITALNLTADEEERDSRSQK